jgi:hypothetical protein
MPVMCFFHLFRIADSTGCYCEIALQDVLKPIELPTFSDVYCKKPFSVSQDQPLRIEIQLNETQSNRIIHQTLFVCGECTISCLDIPPSQISRNAEVGFGSSSTDIS